MPRYQGCITGGEGFQAFLIDNNRSETFCQPPPTAFLATPNIPALGPSPSNAFLACAHGYMDFYILCKCMTNPFNGEVEQDSSGEGER